MRGLLGDGAPLSAPSIARLKAGWQAEYELWRSRAVENLEVVYLWVDGVYVKAGLETAPQTRRLGRGTGVVPVTFWAMARSARAVPVAHRIWRGPPSGLAPRGSRGDA